MKRILGAIVLCLVVVWYALLDRCLIVTSGMPLSPKIGLLLVLQVCAGAFLLTLFVSRRASAAIQFRDRRSRMNLLLFGVPSMFFLFSPAIISEVLNREHYGINKFVVHAHVARDLRCCVNPVSAWSPPPPVVDVIR
jgi:hypothetical protein